MLRQMLVSVQALVLPQPFLYLRDAKTKFDEEGRLVDATVRDRLGELVTALGEWTIANRTSAPDTASLVAV
jgi:hypothetical protein